MIGQEHELNVEQQHDRHGDDGEPRHTVQEHADDAAALGSGNGLGEEEIVELEAQGMGALVRRLEHADGSGELQRFARELHELPHDPQVQQDEQDGCKYKEAGKLDLHL
jgi:hypothetical protein